MLITAVVMAGVQRQFERRDERLSTDDARDRGRRNGRRVGRIRRGCGGRDGGGVVLLTVGVELLLGLHRLPTHDTHVTVHHLQSTNANALTRGRTDHSSDMFSYCDRELRTAILENGLDGVKMTQHVKYIGQRSFHSKAVIRKQTHRTECSVWTTKVINN